MMINRKCIPDNHSRGFRLLAMVFAAIVVVAAGTSCSSTSALKEGEQLFTGLKKIEYTDYEPGGYADSTILEMELCIRDRLLSHAFPCSPLGLECFLAVGWRHSQVDYQGIRLTS